jgi:hypothetical protein
LLTSFCQFAGEFLLHGIVPFRAIRRPAKQEANVKTVAALFRCKSIQRQTLGAGMWKNGGAPLESADDQKP